MDFAGIGIIYNKAIFDQYGLKAPTTYSELEEVAFDSPRKWCDSFRWSPERKLVYRSLHHSGSYLS
jgi:hypothetical protein